MKTKIGTDGSLYMREKTWSRLTEMRDGVKSGVVKIVNDCPANRQGDCFCLDQTCQYMDKRNCEAYMEHLHRYGRAYRG